MRRSRIVSLAVLALLAAGQARAASYYTAKTGRDTNSGSLAAPFLTIKRGLSALKPGDTLYVRAGTYAEAFTSANIPNGTSWGSPTTLSAYPGETVVIRPPAGSPAAFRLTTTRYFVITGVILDLPGVSYGLFIPNATASGVAHHIRIKDSEIRNSPGMGVLVGVDSNYNEFINLKVHHNGGTSPKDHGFYINGSYNLIERCDIYNSGGYGISIYNGYPGKTSNNNIIRYNKLRNNSYGGAPRGGLGITSGSNNIAHNNLIWGNGYGILVNWGAIGTKLYNNTIYANTVGSSGRYGILLGRENSSGADVRNNIVYGNPDGQIVNQGQSGVTLSNNVTTDPKFVSAAGLNFQLASGSPAIDAGANLSAQGITTDILGKARPQGAAYDAGAYEYGGASPSPSPAPTPTPETAGCVTGTAGTWKNSSLPSQVAGTFTVTFDATPAAANIDGVMGLSKGSASGFTALAAAVRFNTAGRIDARNGGAYAAAAAIPYSAKTAYRFRLVVNLAAKTYSAYVRQGTAAEQLIGANYAFRTEQRAVDALSHLGVYGPVAVCALAATASPTGTTDSTPPVISAVAATAVTGTGATISWTTNEPADSQVEYGPSTAYGTATPLKTARVTSHGVTLSGLAPGALYHYRVKSKDAAGNLAASADGTFATAASADAGCVTSANVWRNVSLTARTGTFTVEFDATPAAGNIDGVMGVSNGPASSWSQLAAAVRFATNGRIDARNGGAYAAAGAITYVAGRTYRFRLVVNLASKTYTAYVREGTAGDKLIGTGYAFRTEQRTTTTLNNLGVFSSVGSVKVCNAAVR